MCIMLLCVTVKTFTVTLSHMGGAFTSISSVFEYYLKYLKVF